MFTWYHLFFKNVVAAVMFLLATLSHANSSPLTLFPIEKYDQSVAHWISKDAPNYEQSLVEQAVQQRRFEIFYNHYFGEWSPWNANYVKQILQSPAPNDLKTLEQQIFADLNNQNKSSTQIAYGENFRPYEESFFQAIADQIDFDKLGNLSFQSENRAIAIENISARALPTMQPHFYNHNLAGQGYPFDNLQVSTVWVGTPLYILAETKNKTWSLVLTPDFVGWVKGNRIARVNNNFVEMWRMAAKKNLAAITKTKVAIKNNVDEFLFSAYVGSIFPAETTSQGLKLMVPVKTRNGKATIKTVLVDHDEATLMPLALTPKNLAMMMQTLIGRNYGWGGMYFYNDCSAELKSLFTPFGFWLPRHSSDQVTVGKLVDMSNTATDARINYLIQNGKPFLTIVYIGGHVFLYVGNYTDAQQQLYPMTYQNIWGLRPKESNDSRAVIGKAVLFPLLQRYPEDATLMSPAAKPLFKVSYLNEFPDPLALIKPVNLRSLMYQSEENP